MVQYVYIIFSILIISSCSSDKTTVPVKEKESIVTIEKRIVVKEEPEVIESTYERITNENVKEFLTAYGKENKETVIRLTCPYGDIDIKLYTNTPLHRADMIYLTKRGYFDLTQFYRVSKDFVDQAGNSDEWDCQEMRAKIGGYVLPAEFRKENIHKYGAVAMARRYDKNPKKSSSPFEFYIVLGRTWNKVEIRSHEREFGTSYSPEQYKTYAKIGGTPYLDQEHTVIGEVIAGMDVAIELNKVKVDNREWPLTEIPISMKVLR
jgi:peptidyl-prolyl cis-trans isomerase B (cyclophilin B)